MEIKFIENGVHLLINVNDDKEVRLLHCSAFPFEGIGENTEQKFLQLVEVHESGMNQNNHHGSKHTGSSPGILLKYESHHDYRNAFGRKLEVTQSYDGLYVTSHLQFYDNISVIKSFTTLENKSERERPIEFVSSFYYAGLKGGRPVLHEAAPQVHIPHSTWYGEAQWKSYTPAQLGYDVVNTFSVKRISKSSTGSWSSSEYLPIGVYESAGEALLWQIETSGSWHWEISDIPQEMYLSVSGPTYQESGFLVILKSGDGFESVPCSVSVINGDFEASIQEITKYRRLIRRKNEDNENPSVIFNDYMNCLSGDPTTAKLLPLIDAAAEAGCKYFCIDCGWYDDGPWWDGVGEWLPAKNRFPNGILEPIDYIRSKGMIPGLWLELEVMGINCPLKDKVSEDWFFKRNGRVVVDESRYQLDFRNEEVIAHASGVIKRLVEEYGVGYIKMDYNINAGLGTETNADSVGDGLLQHKRAYIKWLDNVFASYPELVIENCGSGGMRMDYSLLQRHSIQSVTDQTDYLLMSAIAANCMTAVTPEQAAIWSYPLKEGDDEEVIFNMVNAILFRIHQSGHLAEISKERFALVEEGITYHKSICNELKDGLPIWPIGLAKMSDDYLAVGIDCGNKIYLAVWRIGGEDKELVIPLTKSKGKKALLSQGYPAKKQSNFEWDGENGELHVQLGQKTARILEINVIS